MRCICQHVIAAGLLAIVAALPARAEEPLGLGYWAFPHEAGKTPAEIDASCRTGFSINLGGGHWMSFLLENGRWINDGIDACTYDAAASTHTCSLRYWQNGAWGDYEATTVYSTDASGVIKAEATLAGQTNVSYPTPCPIEAIRDVLAEGLSPLR
ncbi:MAG: hypothetical protein KF849_08120 [Rhizobiaceae bacterium]|nr:hypothetical protein [Rhizobiaceae bacterium]